MIQYLWVFGYKLWKFKIKISYILISFCLNFRSFQVSFPSEIMSFIFHYLLPHLHNYDDWNQVFLLFYSLFFLHGSFHCCSNCVSLIFICLILISFQHSFTEWDYVHKEVVYHLIHLPINQNNNLFSSRSAYAMHI